MPDLIYKQWISVIDERTTAVCLHAAGQVRRIDKLFSTDNGDLEAPPAHINCRATVMPSLAGVDNRQLVLAKKELGRRDAARLARAQPPPKPRATRRKSLPAPHRVRKPSAPIVRHGMGDIILGPDKVAEMRNGSAEKFLIKNRDGSYRFTAARQRLHDRIVEDTLVGKTRVDKPTYHLLGGGPGSGKTTLVNSGKVASLGERNAVLVNVDEVRALLPEYTRLTRRGDKAAAAFTHEESSHIAGRIQAAAFERRLNVTLDGTGDGSASRLRSKIDAARAAGYSVQGVYVTVPTDLAVARAEARGAATGRYVPETYLRKTHAAVSHTYREAFRAFDGAQVWDMGGDTPKLLATWDGHRLTVLDRRRWKEFLRKADE